MDTVLSTESFQVRDLTGARALEVGVSGETVAEGRTKTAADLIRPRFAICQGGL